MLIALLLLIVLILLFGAAAVRGWLKNGLVFATLGLGVLLVIGYAKNRYDASKEAEEHDSLVSEARRLALADVAKAASRPVADLKDVATYAAADNSDFAICGTIAGTEGYGGEQGRQRFLSGDGTTVELERPSERAAFDERVAARCRVISRSTDGG